MAGGRAARGGARGGEGIQAARPTGARLAVALAALGLAAGLGAWLSFSATGTLRSITLLLAGPALVALVAAFLLHRAEGIPIAILLLGTAYALKLLAEVDALDGRAPLVAAALYSTAELSYWSLELRSSVAEEAGSHLRRLSLLAGAALAVLALGILLLALAEVAGRGGVAVEAVGVAAAVAALALLALAARRAAS